jgi:hypothetical protein
MPWSSAQITDAPAGSTTRLSRMDFPVVVIVPPRSCGVWQTWVDGGEPGRRSLGPPLD